MNIIKLNAIPSTNDYLKDLSKQYSLPDFTVVVAEHQTKGKGQMGEIWQSESGKGLLFSVLVSRKEIDSSAVFLINVLAALAVIHTLESYDLDGLAIKWPNDILSYNKKIGGILIENIFKSTGEIQMIIGIGLNLYQTDFSSLPQASSVYHAYQKKIDKDELLNKIVEYIQKNIPEANQKIDFWWNEYHDKLYKKNQPNLFEKEGQVFTGIVRGATKDGFLQLEDESGKIQTYGLKEVKMIY